MAKSAAKRGRKKAKTSEPVQQERQEIEEPRLFEMMYLEKTIKEAALQAALQGKMYDERINQMKVEKNNVIRQWEVNQRRAMKRLVQVQQEIEEKHAIKLFEWGYDDETGVLAKHPPEVLEEVYKQRKMQREVKEAEDAKVSTDKNGSQREVVEA